MTEETRRHQTPMIREDGIGAMLQAVAEEIVWPTPEPNVWLRGGRFDADRWDERNAVIGGRRARPGEDLGPLEPGIPLPDTTAFVTAALDLFAAAITAARRDGAADDGGAARAAPDRHQRRAHGGLHRRAVCRGRPDHPDCRPSGRQGRGHAALICCIGGCVCGPAHPLKWSRTRQDGPDVRRL